MKYFLPAVHTITAVHLQLVLVLLLLWDYRYCIDVSADSNCQPPDDEQNSEGVCVGCVGRTSSDDGDDASELRNNVDTCPIADFGGGWVLSARTLGRNAIVPGLFPDLMIPWKQHSARSFPRWGRHHYFFRNPNAAQINQTTEFIFAPGYKYPVECHKVYANLAVNYSDVFISSFRDATSTKIRLNPPIQTDRAISIGDPLFMPCIDTTLSSRKDYDEFPPTGFTTDALLADTEYCLDSSGIYVDEIKSMTTSTDESTNIQYGTFASRHIEKGTSITWGLMIPLHRSELRDPLSKQDELLLNYCYTPDRSNYTSTLLLLPIVPGANAINHANRTEIQQPNVVVMWMETNFDPENFFVESTEILFGSAERSDDRPPLTVEYVAIRDIAAGEELLLDYGDAWQNAWEEHALKQLRGDVSEFRHPIGLPEDMIPSDWLRNESTVSRLPYREWLLPKLQAGELLRIHLDDSADDSNDDELVDTRQIQGMVDRVGLLEGMSEFMAKWADEIGITEVLRAHVRGELTLPPEGERRLRLKGTTWWVKRFPVDWRSDMHYISPDDFESNQMFMKALADAGFDTVLNAVGQRDNLTTITVYYPSYIAVSHCTSALMHSDSEEDGHYNVIFPVLQVNNSKPELIVGDNDNDLFAPYKYETDHAVVLGKFGLHGTAPCDYRGTDSMRMVVSVYMLDGENLPTREKVLRDWINSDPPYPRVPDRVDFIENTKHWKRDDAELNLRNPLINQEEVFEEVEYEEIYE